MNVAMIIEHLDPQRGGAEHSTSEMARLLARAGADVTIVAGNAGAVDLPNVRIVDLSAGASRRLSTSAMMAKASAFVKANAFDVVHAVTPIVNADVYQPRGGLIDEIVARNIARRRGLSAAIRRILGPNRKQRHLRDVERQLARNGRCVFLCVSEYVRRQCERHLHLSDDRVRVVFNGIDVERFAQPVAPSIVTNLRALFRLSDADRVGLFVANNPTLKGIDPLLNAMVTLSQGNRAAFNRFKLLIVTTADFWQLARRAERMGLGDSVRFVGPTQQIERVLAIATFLVHPTWYDPCSRCVLESLAAGKPAITTAYNGAAELVRACGAGVVVDEPGDVKALTTALATMMDDAACAGMAIRTSFAAERLSMARHVNELMEVYKDVAAEKRRDGSVTR
jgi:UDP-glucose:(heptosyl)LPS alpha-1,3-glucosyltransferase